MSANIKVSGKVYNGVNTISVKDENNDNVSFLYISNVAERDVNFYDFDGSIVKSFYAADFANLSAMPTNPVHEGLVAEGWNWTLADAKTYVSAYGKLNIGQMYHTASGKTEYDVEINEATGMTATLTGTSGTQKDWGDGTVDTNETHTYATEGSYTIKLSGTTLPSIEGSKKIRAVRIASGVTSVGGNVFNTCYSLQSVTIPSGVISIGSGAFQNCNSLQSVTIPSSVTSIGDSAFRDCSSLQFVTIPSGVTSIGDSAFHNCHSLQSFTISGSVTSIGDSAFYGCYSLQSVVIPSGVTSIGVSAFSNCKTLQSVTIPSTVTSIGVSAFSACYLLQSVVIPIGVTNIGNAMFSNCHSLQSVVIPSSVTSIGSYAFNGCDWLTTVTVLATTPPTLLTTNAIPSTVTKIYIPNGTLAAYQSATNWASFSSKFVELPA